MGEQRVALAGKRRRSQGQNSSGARQTANPGKQRLTLTIARRYRDKTNKSVQELPSLSGRVGEAGE